MLASLLLTFREGLEAALIVSIILSYLKQIGHQDRRNVVWTAVAAASVLSLALALGLQAVGAEFEGKAEQIFEGTAMLLAVGVLTWMIFWMRYQSRRIKSTLEAEIRVAANQGHNLALFTIAFMAVFREGVETALFLTAASFVSDGPATWTGSVIGLAVAVVVGWLIYTSTARLNVRRFFDVNSILLLIFAAGLFAHGIHEFQEAGWLPTLVDEVWNLKPVLDDESTVGAVLRTLVGYNDNPNLLEALSYLGYWVLVWGLATWWTNRRVVNSTAPSNA